MVEVGPTSRHEEPKQQPKPAQQSTEPAPTRESARNALQQSMERRW
jgi:hypothetical protein